MSDTLPDVWTKKDAWLLCRAVEQVCVPFGCHVALTGGLLYKEGNRKDCDILFYRVRQTPEINVTGLFEALTMIGLEIKSGIDWCFKATYAGRPVDIFFPEGAGDPLNTGPSTPVSKYASP